MATYTWRLPGGGDFNTPSNWTLDGATPASTAPGPNDTGEFYSATTGTISGNFDVYGIHFNNDASNWTFTGQSTLDDISIRGTLTLASGASITDFLGLGVAIEGSSSGTLIVGPGASYYGKNPAQTALAEFTIGGNAGATGTAIIQGPGALVDTGVNAALVGWLPGSTGSLKILAGGVAKFATTDPADLASLTVGRQGTGTVTVDGAGSQLQLTGYMYAGRAGIGTVTLSNGASLTETPVGAGFASYFGGSGNPLFTGGTGTLNVLSGSTATFGDAVVFGRDGGTGFGLVSDGTLNVGGLIKLGRASTVPGGKGTLTINDGGVVHDTHAADPSTPYVLVGANANTTGTVLVDGPGSILDAGANAIDIGTAGSGTATDSNHGLIKSSGLTVGDAGTGTLDVTGGADAITGANSGIGAALAVGAQAGGIGSVGISGFGSALIAVGEVVLGGTDTGTGAVAGGTGDVSVSQGGLLGTESMVIESGSSLGIDGTSAALIAGNLSDGGAITTSGLLAVTGTVSGADSLTLDGGLANLGNLDGTNVSFGSASAALRIQGLSGTSDVSGMQVGDIFDLAGQQGVALTGDTVTTKSGMAFLSQAPAGETYKLIHLQDGTAVVLTPASGHGMSEMGTADTGLSFAMLDDLPNVSADLLQHLGISLGMSSLSLTATNEMSGYVGIGDGLASAAFDLPTAGQHCVG